MDPNEDYQRQAKRLRLDEVQNSSAQHIEAQFGIDRLQRTLPADIYMDPSSRGADSSTAQSFSAAYSNTGHTELTAHDHGWAERAQSSYDFNPEAQGLFNHTTLPNQMRPAHPHIAPFYPAQGSAVPPVIWTAASRWQWHHSFPFPHPAAIPYTAETWRHTPDHTSQTFVASVPEQENPLQHDYHPNIASQSQQQLLPYELEPAASQGVTAITVSKADEESLICFGMVYIDCSIRSYELTCVDSRNKRFL